VLHLVSPTSLRSWLPFFVTLGPQDKIVWLGESSPLDAGLEAELAAAHRAASATVVHSSHHTLERDASLGQRLCAAGGRVLCQTPEAARLGTDKIAMKRRLDLAGLPSIPWRHASTGVGPDSFANLYSAPYVVKQRRGTEGQRLTLGERPRCTLGDDWYEEPFVAGTEYSVNVFTAPQRTVTFPSIWKGDTRRDLLPPYKRLRLVPAPCLDAAADAGLRGLAVAAARALGSIGFAEVELIIGGDRVARIMEVNPRIAGTLRLSAMTTGVRVFDLPSNEGAGVIHLPAVRHAAEVPAVGDPWCVPERDMFCTSRLTVAADSYRGLRRALRDALELGAIVPPGWCEQFDEVMRKPPTPR
jgi:hypothetical protein